MEIRMRGARFTSPNKRKRDLVVFSDNFNRADSATPGATSTGGLAWMLQANGGTPVARIIGNRFQVSNSLAGDRRQFATVDTARTKGRLRVVLPAIPSSFGAAGAAAIVWRYTDASNYLSLTTSSSGGWILAARVAGANVGAVVVPGVTATAGQVIDVLYDEATISVFFDGVLAITQSNNQLATATRVGVGSAINTGTNLQWSGGSWDDISFIVPGTMR